MQTQVANIFTQVLAHVCNCNTSLQYRLAIQACICMCLQLLAHACNHLYTLSMHACICTVARLHKQHVHAHNTWMCILAYSCLATRACPCLHSCTLLQHVHACTHLQHMHVHAHIHLQHAHVCTFAHTPPHAHAWRTHACGCTPACPQPPPISGCRLIAAVPPRPAGVNSEAYRGRPGGVAGRR